MSDADESGRSRRVLQDAAELRGERVTTVSKQPYVSTVRP
jgi:hypothetical protein